MDTAKIDVGGGLAVRQDFHEVLRSRFNNRQVANGIKIFILGGNAPPPSGFATTMFEDVVHDFLPGAGTEFRVGTGKINAGKGDIEDSLIYGVVICLGETLRLGFVAGFKRFLPPGFLVDEGVNACLAAKETELDLHWAGQGEEAEKQTQAAGGKQHDFDSNEGRKASKCAAGARGYRSEAEERERTCTLKAKYDVCD